MSEDLYHYEKKLVIIYDICFVWDCSTISIDEITLIKDDNHKNNIFCIILM